MPYALKKAIDDLLLAYEQGGWLELLEAARHLKETYEPVRNKL